MKADTRQKKVFTELRGAGTTGFCFQCGNRVRIVVKGRYPDPELILCPACRKSRDDLDA